MKQSAALWLSGGMVVLSMYVGVLLGEFVSMTAAFQHLRHEIGVPSTFLRAGVLSLTLLPVAFVAGRCILSRFSRAAGSIALLGSALAFMLIISQLLLLIYNWAVWSASLLKIAFAAAGLKLAAISSLSRA